MFLKNSAYLMCIVEVQLLVQLFIQIICDKLFSFKYYEFIYVRNYRQLISNFFILTLHFTFDMPSVHNNSSSKIQHRQALYYCYSYTDTKHRYADI